MRHDFKKIVDNWSSRGYDTDSDIDSFAPSVVKRGENSLAVLIGGLFRMIADNNSVNAASLDRLVRRLDQIIKKIEDAQGEQQKDVIADAMLLSLTSSVPAQHFVTLDVSELGDVRSRNAIRKSECRTPAELAAFGADNLLGLRNVGISTVCIIRDFLFNNYGLKLAE